MGNNSGLLIPQSDTKKKKKKETHTRLALRAIQGIEKSNHTSHTHTATVNNSNAAAGVIDVGASAGDEVIEL